MNIRKIGESSTSDTKFENQMRNYGRVNVWSRYDGGAVNKVETTFALNSPWN